MIGTAGWGIASRHADAFPAAGPASETHLQRYAGRLGCVEVNSSFYRPHRPHTWERWAASVPGDFRFAVKAPRTATHDKGLAGCEDEIDAFAAQIGHLGTKLGVVLVQTPPRLSFDEERTSAFIDRLAARTRAAIAFEPRHRSWFDGRADRLFERLGVARVAADPARFPGADEPGGTSPLAYFRFHGSPKIYHSDYPPETLARIASRLRQARAAQVWCIFDNTADGHALSNALALESITAAAEHGAAEPR